MSRAALIVLLALPAGWAAGCHGTPPMEILDAGVAYDFAAVPGYSGSPCRLAAQCMGSRPLCLTVDGSGATWPDGYCTSSCDTRKNAGDPPFVNPDCPGGLATCSATGATAAGRCYTACTSKRDFAPCTRAGYACWSAGCRPAALSECDPTVRGACPQDGGSPLPDPDGGAPGYSGRSCARFGDDDVGLCVDGCDVHAQRCAEAGRGCYASLDTGEGTCASPAPGGGDGTPCRYLNSCDPGLGCRLESGQNLCRAYCRTGERAIACPPAQSCHDLSETVKSDTVGLCGP